MPIVGKKHDNATGNANPSKTEARQAPQVQTWRAQAMRRPRYPFTPKIRNYYQFPRQ